MVFKEVGAGTDEGKVVGGGLEAGAGEIRKEVTDGVEERSGGDGERSWGDGERNGGDEGEARTVKSVIVDTLSVATFGTSIEEVGKIEMSV